MLNKGHIAFNFHPRDNMSDFGQCSNRLQLYLISLLVTLSYDLGQIMTIYEFLETRWMILSIDFNLTWFHFWSIFCGHKYNYKWRSYQADRPIVFSKKEHNFQENAFYFGKRFALELMNTIYSNSQNKRWLTVS